MITFKINKKTIKSFLSVSFLFRDNDILVPILFYKLLELNEFLFVSRKVDLLWVLQKF